MLQSIWKTLASMRTIRFLGKTILLIVLLLGALVVIFGPVAAPALSYPISVLLAIFLASEDKEVRKEREDIHKLLVTNQELLNRLVGMGVVLELDTADAILENGCRELIRRLSSNNELLEDNKTMLLELTELNCRILDVFQDDFQTKHWVDYKRISI